MVTPDTDTWRKVVTTTREVDAPAERVFELIADPAQQPRWDGNDNLLEAAEGQRVHGDGEVFVTSLKRGRTRENHVVEFEEGRRIAWRPADPGSEPAGHLWRWQVTPLEGDRSEVTHTYDWSELRDPKREERARSTTPGMLRASLDRLAEIAEAED